MTPSKRQKDVNLGNPHPGGEGSSVCEAGVLLLWGMFLPPISGGSGLLPLEQALLEESRSSGPLFSPAVRDRGQHPWQSRWWLGKGVTSCNLCSAQAEWVGSCARA